jgi:hypothetical protein
MGTVMDPVANDPALEGGQMKMALSEVDSRFTRGVSPHRPLSLTPTPMPLDMFAYLPRGKRESQKPCLHRLLCIRRGRRVISDLPGRFNTR